MGVIISWQLSYPFSNSLENFFYTSPPSSIFQQSVLLQCPHAMTWLQASQTKIDANKGAISPSRHLIHNSQRCPPTCLPSAGSEVQRACELLVLYPLAFLRALFYSSFPSTLYHQFSTFFSIICTSMLAFSYTSHLKTTKQNRTITSNNHGNEKPPIVWIHRNSFHYSHISEYLGYFQVLFLWFFFYFLNLL